MEALALLETSKGHLPFEMMSIAIIGPERTCSASLRGSRLQTAIFSNYMFLVNAIADLEGTSVHAQQSGGRGNPAALRASNLISMVIFLWEMSPWAWMKRQQQTGRQQTMKLNRRRMLSSMPLERTLLSLGHLARRCNA